MHQHTGLPLNPSPVHHSAGQVDGRLVRVRCVRRKGSWGGARRRGERLGRVNEVPFEVLAMADLCRSVGAPADRPEHAIRVCATRATLAQHISAAAAQRRGGAALEAAALEAVRAHVAPQYVATGRAAARFGAVAAGGSGGWPGRAGAQVEGAGSVFFAEDGCESPGLPPALLWPGPDPARTAPQRARAPRAGRGRAAGGAAAGGAGGGWGGAGPEGAGGEEAAAAESMRMLAAAAATLLNGGGAAAGGGSPGRRRPEARGAGRSEGGRIGGERGGGRGSDGERRGTRPSRPPARQHAVLPDRPPSQQPAAPLSSKSALQSIIQATRPLSPSHSFSSHTACPHLHRLTHPFPPTRPPAKNYTLNSSYPHTRAPILTLAPTHAHARRTDGRTRRCDAPMRHATARAVLTSESIIHVIAAHP
jgi:hypothetical protein